MKGLMSFLVKAKLVEPAPDEVLVSPEPEAAGVAAAPEVHEPPPPPPEPMPAASSEIQENVPLEAIYQQAGLPPSPFPAEKLLRLLDGLRAMDVDTRKAAVLAMDAADDSWSMADPIQDAQRKAAALAAYRQGLAEQLTSIEKLAGDRIADGKHILENAVAEIRAQIAQLEQLLEREIARSARDIAAIEAGQRAAREAVAREQQRLDQEIERLAEIPASYDAPR